MHSRMYPFRIRSMRTLTHISLLLALCISPYCMGSDANDASQAETTTAESPVNSWQAMAEGILSQAFSLTGIKYKYGGTSPETGFDCSGFVRYVFQQASDLTLPHGARAISQIGQAISTDQLRPGDLVFYKTLKSAFSHVGIYIGDDKFIHSPTNGGGVHVVDMKEKYWAKRFNGARRITPQQMPSTQQPVAVSAE